MNTSTTKQLQELTTLLSNNPNLEVYSNWFLRDLLIDLKKKQKEFEYDKIFEDANKVENFEMTSLEIYEIKDINKIIFEFKGGLELTDILRHLKVLRNQEIQGEIFLSFRNQTPYPRTLSNPLGNLSRIHSINIDYEMLKNIIMNKENPLEVIHYHPYNRSFNELESINIIPIIIKIISKYRDYHNRKLKIKFQLNHYTNKNYATLKAKLDNIYDRFSLTTFPTRYKHDEKEFNEFKFNSVEKKGFWRAKQSHTNKYKQLVYIHNK